MPPGDGNSHPAGFFGAPTDRLGRAPVHVFRGPPRLRLANDWPPFAAVGAVLIILILSFVAGTAASVVTLAMSDPSLPRDAVWPQLIALVTAQVVAIALVMLAARFFSDSWIKALALEGAGLRARDYLLALGIMVAAMALFTGIVWLVDPSSMIEDLAPFRVFVRSDAWWLTLIAVGIGAPLMEELIFRGFLLTALAKSRLGFAVSAVVTTVVWTALHASYSPAGLLAVFLVGLYLSWLVWRTGSLRVAIFCHATYNLGVVLLLMFVEIPGAATAG